jgi:hypothetical protein
MTATKKPGVFAQIRGWYRHGASKEGTVIHSKKKISWHIYEQKKKETVETATKRYNRIGFRWKYWFFSPIVYPFLKWWNKRNYHGVPRRVYNSRLNLFNKAMERSIEKWQVDVVRVGYNCAGTKEWHRRYAKRGGGTCGLFRELKKFVLVWALNNVSNREFVNTFMEQAYITMHEYYKDKPKFQHLVYKSSVAPVPHYMYLYPDIESGKILLLCEHAEMKLKTEEKKDESTETKPTEKRP